MHHVLLIEDSAECQLIAKRALAGPDIQLHMAPTLKEGKVRLYATDQPQVDLILLDLGLPDGDGLSLLDELITERETDQIPVFLLTAKKELTLKVTAFNLGAEDYLVKPMNPIELKARVEMRLRKVASKRSTPTLLRKGDLILNTALLKASIRQGEKERSIDLTTKEFRILSYLAQNENEVYTRAQLVNAIWGESVHVLDRTVDSHICGLRRKLKDHAHYIECVPGAGYRFCIQSFFL